MSFITKYVSFWKKFGWWSKLFIIVVTLHSLIIVSLSIAELVTGDPQLCQLRGLPPDQCDYEWTLNRVLVQFSFSCFQIVHGYDGIFNDNLYELYTSMAVSLLLTGFGIFRFVSHYEDPTIDLIFLITVITAQLFYFIAAFPLHQEYSWRLYRRVGSDKRIRGMFKTYLLFIAILKFDLMFGFINIITSGNGIQNEGYQLGFDIVDGVTLIAFFAFGWLGMKKEIRWMIVIFFCLSPINLLYIAYWFVNIHKTSQLDGIIYKRTAIAVLYIITGTFAAICRFFVVPAAVVVFRNFGNGLSQLSEPRHRQVHKEDDNPSKDLDGEEDIIYDVKGDGEIDWTLEDVITNTYAEDVYVKM